MDYPTILYFHRASKPKTKYNKTQKKSKNKKPKNKAKEYEAAARVRKATSRYSKTDTGGSSNPKQNTIKYKKSQKIQNPKI